MQQQLTFTTGTLATIETLNGSTGIDVVTISGGATEWLYIFKLSMVVLMYLNLTSTSTGLNGLTRW